MSAPAPGWAVLRSALLASVVIGSPSPAQAGGKREAGEGGALSKVVGGLRERTGQVVPPPAAPAPPHGEPMSEPPPRQDPQSGLLVQPYWGTDASAYGMAPYPTYVQGSSVSLYAGIQSVVDSDQSVSFALHTSYGDWGVAIDDTRYFESYRTTTGMETLHLDVWTASLTHRVARLDEDQRTAVWLRAGLAGASSDDLSVLGVAGAVDIAHNASPQLGVDATLRALALQDGIRGLEVRAGVAASLLRVGYRVLKLDVGPALHGPELGLAWRF